MELYTIEHVFWISWTLYLSYSLSNYKIYQKRVQKHHRYMKQHFSWANFQKRISQLSEHQCSLQKMSNTVRLNIMYVTFEHHSEVVIITTILVQKTLRPGSRELWNISLLKTSSQPSYLELHLHCLHGSSVYKKRPSETQQHHSVKL